MNIGFTGTQQGMTKAQNERLIQVLSGYDNRSEIWFHHGDCIGADAQAHSVAQELGFRIAIHPCTILNKRAYCKNAQVVHVPKPPLARNEDIVNDCDIIIATPFEAQEVLRSGTWATIRRCRRAMRILCIIYADGSEDITNYHP